MFSIELSTALTQERIPGHIKGIALLYGCDSLFEMEETNINKNKTRQIQVIHVGFDETNVNNLINFLQKIKYAKNIYIECVYYSDIKCKMLYASPYYIKTNMDKSQKKKYLKTCTYSDVEQSIIDTLH